jgi:hypothetical protein
MRSVFIALLYGATALSDTSAHVTGPGQLPAINVSLRSSWAALHDSSQNYCTSLGKCKDMDKSVSVCIRIREGYIRGYKILILVSADTSIRGRDGFPTDFDGFYGFPTDIPTDISADYPSHFLQSYCCTIH